MKRILIKFAYWILQKYGHIKKIELNNRLYFYGTIYEIESMNLSITGNCWNPTCLEIQAKEVTRHE